MVTLDPVVVAQTALVASCGVRPFKAQLSAAASSLSNATRLLSGIGVSLSAHGGRVMEIP